MIDICDIDYAKAEIWLENCGQASIKYMMTIDCIENLSIAAEVYGIKVVCTTGEGSTEFELRGITANRTYIKQLLDNVAGMKVLPHDIDSAIGKMLKIR